jgi:hypothetical protein
MDGGFGAMELNRCYTASMAAKLAAADGGSGDLRRLPGNRQSEAAQSSAEILSKNE